MHLIVLDIVLKVVFRKSFVAVITKTDLTHHLSLDLKCAKTTIKNCFHDWVSFCKTHPKT